MLYKELNDNINSGQFKNLYLFYGEEDYLKDYYKNMLINRIKDKYGDDVEIIKFTEKFKPSDVIDAFETSPMFGGYKIILIKDSNIFKESSKQKDSSEDYMFFADIPDNCFVIFIENSVAKNRKLYKLVSKKGLCVEFTYLDPKSMTDWVVKQVNLMGKKISANTANYLVNVREPDMHNVYNEVIKLTTYVDSEEITPEDIDLITLKALKSKVFALTDAITNRKPQNALIILNELEQMKEPLQKIYFMITRYIRYLKLAKDLMENRQTQKDADKHLKLSPYESRKFCDQAKLFEASVLTEAVMDCYDYDIAVKNGEMNIRTAIELLIVKYGNRKR